jgi:3-hydroxyisobutyrate dehydrogenase-like beta-hydroxyacid dehydrogenase
MSATSAVRLVSLIGTGIMGAHMARRLAQAGFAVTVWNRDRAKAAPLSGFSVVIADSPSAACANADAVIVMLSNGPVVEEVMFG